VIAGSWLFPGSGEAKGPLWEALLAEEAVKMESYHTLSEKEVKTLSPNVALG